MSAAINCLLSYNYSLGPDRTLSVSLALKPAVIAPAGQAKSGFAGETVRSSGALSVPNFDENVKIKA